MKRIAAVLAMLAAGALLPALPASAANGPPPSVGCPTGDSCQVQLWQFVSFNGGHSKGGGGNQVVVPPPPCLWNPIGDATTGSQAVITAVKDGTTGNGVAQANTKAQALLGETPKPAGEWYQLADNSAASAAAQAQCNAMPLFEFLKPDQVPAGYSLPPSTLAQLAYAKLTTPPITEIQLNPAGTTEANLPTFIKVQLRDVRGALGWTPDGRPYVAITASLNGQSATVWAVSTGLVIDSGAPQSGATTYQSCNHVEANKKGLMLGSAATAEEMTQTQANQAIDCGVTYRQAGTFNLQVSLGWQACWANTGTAEFPPPPPANLTTGCQPVPGAGNLQPRFGNANVTVNEIQSVNG